MEAGQVMFASTIWLLEDVEDVVKCCAIGIFETRCCYRYILGRFVAKRNNLCRRIVDCVGEDAVVNGTRGDILVEKLHIPLRDILDEESGDRETWVCRRTRALLSGKSHRESDGDAGDENEA